MLLYKDSIVLTGSPVKAPDWIPLRCGLLAMQFDPASGWLRRIMVGDREVLRAIYIAVRDYNWNTFFPTLSNLDIQEEKDGFRIAFDARCREHEIDFAWRSVLTGTPEGTLTFTMEGVANSTFRRNRLGFCVLHPVRECKGRPCIVERTDGFLLQASFPETISPHQPFQNMRAISHEVMPGLRAEVRFEGDTFEMEDQRNWTDASFKTYSTPIALPFPVTLPKGTRLAQSVTLTLQGKPRRRPKQPDSGPVKLEWSPRAAGRRIPSLGLCLPAQSRPLTATEAKRLQALDLSHIRVDLRPEGQNGTGWKETLRHAEEFLRQIVHFGMLEIAMFLPEDADKEYADFWDCFDALNLKHGRDRISQLLIYASGSKNSPPQSIVQAKRIFRQRDYVSFYGGTDANFAEMNRQRPAGELIHGACYAINPQVHAFDDASLMENLDVQAETVRSAYAITGLGWAAVSPITLRPRFNPYATGPEPVSPPQALPPQVDARQMSLFGAAWTLGSLKYLAEGGASSATFYETVGWRGVMETEQGSPLPEMFPSIPGTVFPLYHVLADFGERAVFYVPVKSNAPLRVVALVLQAGLEQIIVAANLTPYPQTALLKLPQNDFRATLRRLDADSAERAMQEPESFRVEPGQPVEIKNGLLELELPPYAYLRINLLSE